MIANYIGDALSGQAIELPEGLSRSRYECFYQINVFTVALAYILAGVLFEFFGDKHPDKLEFKREKILHFIPQAGIFLCFHMQDHCKNPNKTWVTGGQMPRRKH